METTEAVSSRSIVLDCCRAWARAPASSALTAGGWRGAEVFAYGLGGRMLSRWDQARGDGFGKGGVGRERCELPLAGL